MKPFIQDNERVLNETTDLLKTGVYADNLVEVIKNTPQGRVFTIGVFGGWGTGKSSIIRTAQDKIEAAHKDKVKFITYDAWKYANDSFRRMFLLKIQRELKMLQTEEMSRFYQSEIAEAEPKTKLSAKGLAIAAGIITIISIILFLIPEIEMVWRVSVPTIGTLGTFLVALLNGCFYDLKISYSKPALFAPEQFEECFKQMMSKCLKDTNWFKKKWEDIKDYVLVGEVSFKGLEKLVIVIDNIDRCPSDMAYQLLTDIKTFLSNEDYNLVFVVPVDDEALKKHLFRKLDQKNYNIDKEKEEFLRKFFNVTLRIKPHQETDLLHFAHEINKENRLGYSNETLAIVAKEFADNPRRIIQLLNNLSGDLAQYEEGFAQKYETAICAALILNEDYPTFYKEATRNLVLVTKYNEHFAKEKDGTVDESLNTFMRVADLTFSQTPVEALQRIFTNTTSIFSDMPVDIQKAVTTYDIAKVVEFANVNKDMVTKLIDFIIERLKTEVKYGATTQFTKWIEFISQLCKVGLFDTSRFNAINESLSRYYKSAISVIKDQDALCFLGNRMAAVGIRTLRDTIIGYLTAGNVKENINYEDVLKAYYSHFTSEQDCNNIATVVEDYYVNNIIGRDVTFTEIQKKTLFGDSFVVKQLEACSSIDDKSHIDNIIWCIKNNDELSSETYTALFAKFIKLFGVTRGKAKSNYLTFVRHLQVILDALPTKSLTNELIDVFGVVTKERGIPNPSWPSTPQRDTRRSILDEVDSEESKALIFFCYEVMRITGGIVDVSASIKKLYTKNKEAVIEGALKIQSQGISLKPLAATLINVDDYESANCITLLGIILSRGSNGDLNIDNDNAKSKIRSLVDNANNKSVELLLGKLVKDEQILGMVAEYVASLDSASINSLPVSISKFAVASFNKETAESYKDNVDYLILVLQQGNASQMKDVVRLMKDKINHEKDIDQVVKVLENLETEDQRILKSLVSELDGLKDSETVNEELKSRIDSLVIKLDSGIKKANVLNKY